MRTKHEPHARKTMTDKSHDAASFRTTLLAAFKVAAESYPTKTCIYIHADLPEQWSESTDLVAYIPIDPWGQFFSDFVKVNGGVASEKIAIRFVDKYCGLFFRIYGEFREADLFELGDEVERELYERFNEVKCAEERARARTASAKKLPRLAPGAVSVRCYKGASYEVRILADGKACTVNGRKFSSLTAAARQMFNQRVSGPRFWKFAR